MKTYLATSHDMDSLKQAITKEDFEGISETGFKKCPSKYPTSDEAGGRTESNGTHSKEVNSDSRENGDGDGAKTEQLEQIRTPPRFETFMMTGDLILNLNAKASTGSATVVPKAKRVDCLTFGQSSTPASPDDGELRGRHKGTKRESPSFCSPVADKKAAFGYTGSFVRTSRSEDHLQKDYLTMVNIDIDDDITSSLNTLLDTRHENPANERIVWTYNAPVPHDSVSSSPHSSSPSSPLQSPTYRPLRSPSPTKPSSPKRKAPPPPSSSSPSPSPSPTSKSAPVRLYEDRVWLGSDDYPSGDTVSPTSSEDQSRGTDLETDDSRESSPRKFPAQNGVVERKGSFENKENTSSDYIKELAVDIYESKAISDGDFVKELTKDTRESKLHTTDFISHHVDNRVSEMSATHKISGKDTVLSGLGMHGKVTPKENGEGIQFPEKELSPVSDKGPTKYESPRKSASPPPDDDSDIESLRSFHYSPKAVDMPSACRLAKRLFYLEGFKKSDVSRHLSKK